MASTTTPPPPSTAPIPYNEASSYSAPSPPTMATNTLSAPILSTSRLHIIPVHLSLACSVHRAASNPSIARYMADSFPNPYTLASASSFIAHTLSTDPPHPHFSIVLRRDLDSDSNPNTDLASEPVGADEAETETEHENEIGHEVEVIGGIGLKPGTDVHSHTAEVGYWIGAAYQRRGYATEALSAFVRWCFAVYSQQRVASAEPASGARSQKTELTRLTAGVHSGNEGSVRVLERCGFVVEGVLRGHVEKEGEVRDYIVLGLQRAQWERWVEEHPQ